MSFTLTITFTGAPGSAINPDFAITAQNAGSGGNPDSLTVTGGYIGADPLDLWLVTSSSATPPSVAQMKAGSGGGIVEQATILGYTGTQVDLAGFTNETFTHFHFLVEERNNGGTSGISTVALNEVDFTAPTVSSAATNTAGDEVTITFDDNIWGTNSAGNFSIPGHTIGGITGADGDTTRVLTGISPAIANGDVDTVGYTPGDLTDERGNALASFSGQSITNNVGSSSLTVNQVSTELDTANLTTYTFPSRTYTGTGDVYVTVAVAKASTTNDNVFSGGTVGAQSLSIVANTSTPGLGNNANYSVGCMILKAPSPGAGSHALSISVTSNASGMLCEIIEVDGVTSELGDNDEQLSTSSINFNQNVLNGDYLMAVGVGENNVSAGFTGLTSNLSADIRTSEFAAVGSQAITADESPRTLSFDQGASNNLTAAIVRLRA